MSRQVQKVQTDAFSFQTAETVGHISRTDFRTREILSPYAPRRWGSKLPQRPAALGLCLGGGHAAFKVLAISFKEMFARMK